MDSNNQSFQEVFGSYCRSLTFSLYEGTAFDHFNKFYELDLTPINNWLSNQFKNDSVKNTSLSITCRREGNTCFGKKDLMGSIQHYTKSLCYAIPLSEEYGLALANRSAVTFEMKKYADALKDINLCLIAKYPDVLRPKVLFRKIECLLHLANRSEISKFLNEIEPFLEINQSFTDREKFIEKLNELKNMTASEELQIENSVLPELENGENPNFAYASSKIELRYNSNEHSDKKGRYVAAKEPISMGDVLFVEKAFSFGAIFDEKTKNINPRKCYHCLNDILSGIPCNSCIQCIFCDEKCRDSAWEESHRWECLGMQKNIWYDLSIVFPAFRALLKGIKVIFNKPTIDPKNVDRFGDKNCNYPYFDSLIHYTQYYSVEILVGAATVVRYLEDHTDFFNLLSTDVHCEMDSPNLMKYVGGLLTKHALHLKYNASIIEHWVPEKTHLLPFKKESIACGIFPSVSLMNHCCKANIVNYFVADTIVVKAVRNIEENEEITNCYGVDYRSMNWEARQNICVEEFNFYCECDVCSNFENELESFSTFKCHKCGFRIPKENVPDLYTCEKCKASINFKKMLESSDELPEIDKDFWLRMTTSELLSILPKAERLMSDKHYYLQEIYEKLYVTFLNFNNFEEFIKYFRKWYENEKCRMGENSVEFIRNLYNFGSTMLRNATSATIKNEAISMIREAKFITSLYYPNDYLKKKEWDV